MNNSEIFVHIGLPKTGTTFLQDHVFSNYNAKDISYLGKAKSISVWDIMKTKNNKYLISSENLLADHFEGEKGKWFVEFKNNLKILHNKLPNAKYILSVRNHKDLIISCYKEFIRKGNRSFYPEIMNYFDIDKNNGQISQNDFIFENIIKEIRIISGNYPFVFSLEGWKENPDELFKNLENFLNIPEQHITLNNNKKARIGCNTNQAKFLIFFNRLNNGLKKIGINLYNPLFIKYGLTPDYIIMRRCYWLPGQDIQLPNKISEFIESKYAEDWAWTNKYIHNQIVKLNEKT